VCPPVNTLIYLQKRHSIFSCKGLSYMGNRIGGIPIFINFKKQRGERRETVEDVNSNYLVRLLRIIFLQLSYNICYYRQEK